MRKNTKKAVCIIFAVLLLACSFPISAFAVDPVSASVIANSFAQAITAYGASHGVSLTFDSITSGNTEQIGQSVHELWARFRAGQQTADDYDTIAAAVFPGLYNKVIKAGGTAVVGMSIAQEYMPDIDGFWNWLLSGPAEMVKVDNAYQWNTDPSTGDIVRPVVLSTALTVPYLSSFGNNAETFNSGKTGYYYTDLGSEFTYNFFTNRNVNVYPFVVENRLYAICSRYSDLMYCTKTVNGNSISYNCSYPFSSSNSWSDSTTELSGFRASLNMDRYSDIVWYLPVYSSLSAACIDFKVYTDAGTTSVPDITVAPYVGDVVARPVPLPDVGDPDYGPVPWAGDLDVPWNDTLFGDGTGTLTDAQKGAITQELDGVIENDGTLTLEGDQTAPGPDDDDGDDPSDDPDDYGVIGLENVFPFCIPFDIYNFLSALSAAPTAPHFTATLQLPEAVGGTQTIELDFDNPTFNQLARLLRLLELLAFIVGLALLTRSMFIRG